MPQGTVKFYNVEKGYGFIAPDDGSDDVFVHASALVDELDALNKNEMVRFETGIDKRSGRIRAINVRLA